MSVQSEITRIETEVDTQAGLLVEILTTLQNKTAGGDALSNIIDEVYLKTGLSGDSDSDQLVLDIASIATDTGNTPAYVRTEARRVAAVVSELQGDDTFSFVAFSDVHVGPSDQSKASITHLAQAVGIISDCVDIDFVASLGDTVMGSSSDNMESQLANHLNALRFLAPAGLDLRLAGNHDYNPYNTDGFMTAEQVNNRLGRYSVVATKPSTEAERGYFYYDLTAKKVRVICLNTADLKDADPNAFVDCQMDGHHISAEQFTWLVSALDMTNKSGWSIVVLSHHPLHWYGSMPKVLKILDAYVAGSSGSVTADSSTISYDFAGKNAATLVGTFHGHTHNLISGKEGTAEIPRICTPNGCFSGNNSYNSSSHDDDFRAKYGEETTYAKTADSATDTAFCVYTIDRANNTIYATCYGAGYDRVITYNGASESSYTNVIDEVGYTDGQYASGSTSGSDSATTLTGWFDYPVALAATTAPTIYIKGITLNAATSTSYSHERVQVAAADGTVMSTFYSGSPKIEDMFAITTLADQYYKLVPKLSGGQIAMLGYCSQAISKMRMSLMGSGADLIITLDEPIVEEEGYTNIVDTIGYSDDYRLSTSTGELRAQDGYVTTGFIDTRLYAKPLIIRTKGVDFRASDHGYSAYVWYSADETFFSANYLDVTENSSVIIAFDDDGNLTFTINSISDTNPLIRLCGSGSGANLIVTVNEEITENEPTGDYTNLVPTSINTDGSIYNDTGYMTDYRLNSSGTTSALSGAIHSGFIPYNGEVIRVYGNPSDTIGSTGNYIAFYDSSFTKVGIASFNSYDENDITWVVQNGLYLFTVDPNNVTNSTIKNYMTSAVYIRASLSSYSDTSDFVVTLDEEIV